MFRCDCRFAGADSVALSNHAAAIHLYRIAQEAVNNAIKHGKARQIRVSLRLQGKDLGLVVADDGVGFAGDGAARNGMGLRIMRYRAEAIGGQLIVESRRKRGTRVRCCVPHAALLAGGKESANEPGS
jgi:signal transduction histidine kinase